jgi:hypothetical protein
VQQSLPDILFEVAAVARFLPSSVRTAGSGCGLDFAL